MKTAILRFREGLLVSYYSSHEGKAAIYFATLNLKALQEGPE
jgi:hypothetical protein